MKICRLQNDYKRLKKYRILSNFNEAWGAKLETDRNAKESMAVRHQTNWKFWKGVWLLLQSPDQSWAVEWGPAAVVKGQGRNWSIEHTGAQIDNMSRQADRQADGNLSSLCQHLGQSRAEAPGRAGSGQAFDTATHWKVRWQVSRAFTITVRGLCLFVRSKWESCCVSRACVSNKF